MATLSPLSLLHYPYAFSFSPKHSSLSFSSSASPPISFRLSMLQGKPFPFNPSFKIGAFSSPPASSVGIGEDLLPDYGNCFPKPDPSNRRRGGILLHPTSFRGPYGIGDLGEEAFRFIDWLHHAGCSVWQVLPLVPPGRKANEGGSPYSGQDANCGNTLLISLEELTKDGLLTKDELPESLFAT
uniref:4-alpha-glucanotransferase n=1 Tax=Rhizophora mucronata TaxID=61149 RepID=A0A2P2KYF2_RHIMU